MVSDLDDIDNVMWDDPGKPGKSVTRVDDVIVLDDDEDEDTHKTFSFGVDDLSRSVLAQVRTADIRPRPFTSAVPKFKSPEQRKAVANIRRSVSQSVIEHQVSRPVHNVFSTREDDSVRPKKGTARPARAASASPVKKYNKSPAKKGKRKQITVIGEHHAVYCLVSRSEEKKYKGKCYIGYTHDTNRRLQQHNGGQKKGGAKQTEGRGPWSMVFCVEGFPNNVSGLRFEWATQNPQTSRNLKEQGLKKTRKETHLQFKVRVACHLINCAPWRRFALTFRWLIPEERFPLPIKVPDHVGEVEGLLPDHRARTFVVEEERVDYALLGRCAICEKRIDRPEELLRCENLVCTADFHAVCMAHHALNLEGEMKNALFPAKGRCVECREEYVWGRVVRAQHNMLSVLNSHPNPDIIRGRVPRKLLNPLTQKLPRGISLSSQCDD